MLNLASVSVPASISRGETASFEALFRWQDAEPLLEQALVLLAQAEAVRQALWMTGKEFARLELELLHDGEAQDIAEREALKGRFRTPKEVSEMLVAGEAAAYDELFIAEKHAKALQDAADPGQKPAQERMAREIYLHDLQALYGARWGKDDAEPQPSNLSKVLPGATWSPYGDKDVGQSIIMLGERETKARVNEEQARLFEQAQLSVRMSSASSTSTYHRWAAQKKQLAWDAANEEFLRERLELDRRVFTTKKKYRDSLELFDFETQMKSYSAGLGQLVKGAYYRLAAAADGLRKLYGYEDGLSSSVEDLDAHIRWARKAADWTTGMMRRCNDYAVAIPVKAAMDGEWTQTVKTHIAEFVVDRSRFPSGESNFRLRGISVLAECVPGSTFGVTIVPPARADIYRRDTQRRGSSEVKVPGVAQDCPPCRCARVLWTTSDQIPEIVGGRTLYNASPFGQWSVEFSPGARFDGPDGIRDFYLFLHVSSWASAESPIQRP